MYVDYISACQHAQALKAFASQHFSTAAAPPSQPGLAHAKADLLTIQNADFAGLLQFVE
jgi:hypothetical protein